MKTTNVETKKSNRGKRGGRDMSVGILEKLGIGVRPAAAPGPIADIVARAQRGDPAAFGELFRRHVEGVHRHLRFLVGPEEDVDDLVQLVFLNVYQSLAGFRGQAAFSTWLFRITINVARQEIRVRSRLRRLQSAVRDAEAVRRSHHDASQERQLASWQQIYEILDRLPVKKRETYILYMYEGYSLDEIARLVRSSVSTIGSRLQSARREILRILAEGRA
jgi:RNA polymerase sigma-70 factor (ECF subfamily)